MSAFHHGSSLQGPAKINMPWKDFVYFFNNGLSTSFSQFSLIYFKVLIDVHLINTIGISISIHHARIEKVLSLVVQLLQVLFIYLSNIYSELIRGNMIKIPHNWLAGRC